jgi:hypothetical protein
MLATDLRQESHPPTLVLFIDRRSTRTQTTLRHLRRQMNGLDLAVDTLTIYDICGDIEMAIRYRVLATPTLIRTDVFPHRRLVGDLEDGAVLNSFLRFQA